MEKCHSCATPFTRVHLKFELQNGQPNQGITNNYDQRQLLGLNAGTQNLPLLWLVRQSRAAVKPNDIILTRSHSCMSPWLWQYILPCNCKKNYQIFLWLFYLLNDVCSGEQHLFHIFFDNYDFQKLHFLKVCPIFVD